MNIDEFRKYLRIDKHALDDEVVRQSSLFYEVSEAYVMACAVRDQAKESLGYIDAKLDAKYRDLHEKSTEAQVKASIQIAKGHTEAYDTWLKAKEQADLLAALKEAFHQRGYMLRDLVTLHSANYFGETSMGTQGHQDRVVYEHRRQRLAARRDARK